jgi:hypothetical protein
LNLKLVQQGEYSVHGFCEAEMVLSALPKLICAGFAFKLERASALKTLRAVGLGPLQTRDSRL